MSPISWDDLATRDEDPPLLQVGPFPWHVARQEGEDAPPEPAEMNCPVASEPSMVASEPAEPGRLTSSGPSTVAPKPIEIGRPAPSEPSVVPLESVGGSRFDSS